MDPVAAATRLNDAIDCEEWETADEAYEALSEWIRAGGFVPQCVLSARKRYRDYCRE